MKKILFTLIFCAFFINVYNVESQAKEEVVTIEIPASEIDTIDVKYEKPKQTTTKKTVDATKDFTEKTVDGAKDIINNLNPNKPVTLEELETKSQIRILKNEKKGLKSAYNSRIKDIDAKIKATENATNLSTTQKQNKVHTLNKEKLDLINKRDKAMEKYDKKIDSIKGK